MLFRYLFKYTKCSRVYSKVILVDCCLQYLTPKDILNYAEIKTNVLVFGGESLSNGVK